MPRYDFVCLKCDHRFEIVATIHESRPNKCPKCKGELTQDYSSIGINTLGCSLATSHRRIQKDVARDVKAIMRGDDKVMADYCGDKVNDLRAKTLGTGVKYMKDVKKGVVKRKAK
jgi:putative FmdB family regulatory protein